MQLPLLETFVGHSGETLRVALDEERQATEHGKAASVARRYGVSLPQYRAICNGNRHASKSVLRKLGLTAVTIYVPVGK